LFAGFAVFALAAGAIELAGFEELAAGAVVLAAGAVDVLVVVEFVVDVLVVVVFVVAVFAGLALLAGAASPQAMPNAPKTRTDESAITFLILFTVSYLSQRCIKLLLAFG
jgi:hypothetical protein